MAARLIGRFASILVLSMLLAPISRANSQSMELKNETLSVAARFGLQLPEQVHDLQKGALTTGFSRLFKRVKDLSAERVSKYAKARPSEYLALVRYIERLRTENYISGDQATTLQSAATQGLAIRLQTNQNSKIRVLNLDQKDDGLVMSTTYISSFADQQLKQETQPTVSTPELDYALKVFKAALAGEDVEKMAISDSKEALKQEVSQQSEEGLKSIFKNAKVDISKIDGSKPEFEVGVIASVREGDNSNTFQQTTINSVDGLTTLNIGLGHRVFPSDDKWFAGANIFYDQEFPENHQRASVGIEVVSLPVSISSNYYKALSGYTAYEDYVREKPADGYDAKISVALPYLPGVKASYETSRWNFDGVEDLERETYGLTGQLSKNFSVTVENAEYSDGRENERRIQLGYQWNPSGNEPPTIFDVSSEPWIFDSVATEKYKFVDRENRIIKQSDRRRFIVRIGSK